MLKLIKWLFGGLLILILLIALVALIAPRVLDPNDYKDTLSGIVKDKTGRELVIAGDLSLSFFPWLGVKTGQLSLSQPDAIGGNMVSVGSAQLRVKLMPLFSKKVEVDTIVLQQPKINLITLENGVDSFSGLSQDDLPSDADSVENEQPSSEDDANTGAGAAIALVVQGVSLKQGSVIWDDRQAKQKITVNNLDVATGNLLSNKFEDLEVSAIVQIFDLALEQQLQNEQAQTINFDLNGKAKIDVDALMVRFEDVVSNVKTGGDDFRLTIEDIRFSPEVALVSSGIKLEGNGAGFSEQLSALKLTSSIADVKFDLLDEQLLVNSIAFDTHGTLLQAQETNGKQATKNQPFLLASQIPQLVFNLAQQKLNLATFKANGEFAKRPFQLDMSAINVDLKQQLANVPQLKLVSKDLSLNLSGFKASSIIDKPHGSGVIDVPAFNLADLLNELEIDYTPQNPQALTAVAFNSRFSAGMDDVALNNLQLLLDQSKLTGSLAANNFANPAVKFKLALNQLNLDSYLPKESPEGKVTKNDSSKGGVSSQETSQSNSTSPTASSTASGAKATTKSGSNEDVSGAQALAVPMAVFKDIHANGHFTARQLIASGVTLNDLDVVVESTPGRVSITPRAKLYDGSLNGSVVYTELNGKSQLKIKKNIDLVSLGSLLKDADITDQLSGLGSLNIDFLISEEQGQQHNQGTIKLLAKNGAIKGIDIKGVLDNAKQYYNQLKGRGNDLDSGKAKQSDETRFAELLGTFNIKDYNVTNNDFSLKAPLFRVGGQGDINIVQQSLDYLVNVSLVNTSKGQTGEGLDKLKGLTLPVRFTGALTAPDYKIDLKSLYKNMAEQKVKDKKEAYLKEKLGIEGGGELSTKDVFKQALMKKANDKYGSKKPAEKNGDKLTEASPDAPKPEPKSAKEQLKESLEDKILEGLFK